MSFANQNSRWTYAPNGVTTAFAYDNKVLSAAELTVTWYASDGSTLALPGYAVTGVGNDGGGTVVFNAAPAATAGSLIVLERRTDAVQAGEFMDFLQEPAETRKARFERSMALAQEFKKAMQRLLLYSPLDADGALVLPPAALRANKALLFGADGKPTVGNPLAAGILVVSAYVQTLLDDADANAFHATLGWSVFAKGLRTAVDGPAFRAAIGAVGGASVMQTPQGRLTLQTPGAPVMTAAQLNRTMIYYTPYTGQLVPLWDGATFTPTVFAELANDTTASAVGKAGPAAVGNNLTYDGFVWSDVGTVRLSRGPAWATDTTRGAGAGTTELQRVQGVLVNKVDIANGPPAGFGTYVGSFRSNGAAQIDWNPTPAAAAGGGNAMLTVFNAYNRVRVAALSLESTVSWQYNVVNVWRPMANSAFDRISYLDGLGEVAVNSRLDGYYSGPTQHFFGINRDSIAATPPSVGTVLNGSAMLSASGAFAPALGFHYLQAMEADSGGGPGTNYGAGALNGVNVEATSFAADLTM